MKLLYHGTFHELFSAERETPEFEQLLVRMKVVSPEGESELTEDQWEAASESTLLLIDQKNRAMADTGGLNRHLCSLRFHQSVESLQS